MDDSLDTSVPTFNRRVVRPIECLRGGWQLIKGDYWLFLGICVVGYLLSSVGMGFLTGPAMCGMDLCFFRRMRKQQVSFDHLFKGFDFFLPSLIATLIVMVPMLFVVVVSYVVFIVAIVAVAASQPQGRQPDPSIGWIIFGLLGVYLLLLFVLISVIQALFMFAYPLIVDKRMSGLDAVRLSMRAGWANFGGLIGLCFLNMLLGLVGVMACYVGAFFVLPISFAAVVTAYRQVFPEEEPALVVPVRPQGPDTSFQTSNR